MVPTDLDEMSKHDISTSLSQSFHEKTSLYDESLAIDITIYKWKYWSMEGMCVMNCASHHS